MILLDLSFQNAVAADEETAGTGHRGERDIRPTLLPLVIA